MYDLSDYDWYSDKDAILKRQADKWSERDKHQERLTKACPSLDRGLGVTSLSIDAYDVIIGPGPKTPLIIPSRTRQLHETCNQTPLRI